MFQVLDVIDCTGSGDVDMGTIVRADAEGLVEGYSGRKLRPNPGWVNPSGTRSTPLPAGPRLCCTPALSLTAASWHHSVPGYPHGCSLASSLCPEPLFSSLPCSPLTGDWRVGSKHAYSLFSRGLVDRVKEERRKQWDERQRAAVAQAVADLSQAEKSAGEPPQWARPRL